MGIADRQLLPPDYRVYSIAASSSRLPSLAARSALWQASSRIEEPLVACRPLWLSIDWQRIKCWGVPLCHLVVGPTNSCFHHFLGHI